MKEGRKHLNRFVNVLLIENFVADNVPVNRSIETGTISGVTGTAGLFDEK